MKINPDTETWVAVEAAVKLQIEKLREALETEGMETVDAVRGRIAALRWVLELPKQ